MNSKSGYLFYPVLFADIEHLNPALKTVYIFFANLDGLVFYG